MIIASTLRDGIRVTLEKAQLWQQSLTQPKEFLQGGWNPTEDQLLDGLEYYVCLVGVALVLNAPLTLGAKGDFSARIKVLAMAVLNLVFSALIAMTWHYAFSLMGGTASFAGTYLAHVYSFGAYLPILALASLVMMGTLPKDLRQYAGNPTGMQMAVTELQNRGEGSKGAAVGCGGCLASLLILWCSYVQLRCFGFVHELQGTKFLWATVLSLVFSIPLGLIVMPISRLLQEKD